MISEISNAGISRETLRYIRVEDVLVFAARKGRAFAHHSFVCKFRGKFYVMWSSGECNEDDVGQTVYLSASKDFYHWEFVTELKVDGREDAVLTSCGFYVHGGALIAYVGCFSYESGVLSGGRRIASAGDAGHENTQLYAFVSHDGQHFSAAESLGLKLIPNTVKVLNGNLFLCGNFTFAVSSTGDGLSGFHVYGIYDGVTDETVDDSEAFHAAAVRAGMPSHVCESDLVLQDGKYIALFRSQNGGVPWRLYGAESPDGMQWTCPRPTDFSNDTSKFAMGNLPDGRLYYIGNPLRGNREPLVLSVAANGMNFHTHCLLREGNPPLRFSGFAKAGAFAYPQAVCDGEYLYICYTQNKEDVRILRVKLCEIC